MAAGLNGVNSLVLEGWSAHVLPNAYICHNPQSTLVKIGLSVFAYPRLMLQRLESGDLPCCFYLWDEPAAERSGG